MRLPIPREEAFHSRLRSAAVTSRIGLWLGICFALAFVTGLISHYAQVPNPSLPFPTAPSWGYRVTQGVHVVAGSAAVPLLLVKLWSVYPKLFAALPTPSLGGALQMAERGSIAVLVASSLAQLATGLANSAQWYPWNFSFRTTHYALAWIAVGALVLHVAIKLPIIRGALGAPVDDTASDRPSATSDAAISRRTLLRGTWAAAIGAVLLTAGGTVPALRKVSLFAVRTGEGPQGLPVNRTAVAARVTHADVGADWRLAIRFGDTERRFSRADLLALPQQTRRLPIACVEGWSADATWTGVPVRALLDLVDAPTGSDVHVVSLQRRGAFATTVLQGNFADDHDTLLALAVNGETLDLDHGFPARIIAPNRPGVLQTKWVTRLEVES